MISQEKKMEILKKMSNDEDARAMFAAHNVQGLLEKCKEAGFEVTEGDIAEIVVSGMEISDDELGAVSGGSGIMGCIDDTYACGTSSCHN